MNALTRSTAAGTWVAREVRLDSISIQDTINERGIASVTLLDPTGALFFQRGQGIRLTDDNNNILFQGFIDRVTEGRVGVGGTREHRIECVDQHYLTDKRVVADAYTNTTAGDIVRNLISEHLAGEGITEGLIRAGPTVRAITFNYISVADAISDLATRAGFWWRVNTDGTLDFALPVDLTDFMAGTEYVYAGTTNLMAGAETTDGEFGEDLAIVALADTISVVRHSDGYRNRQWVKGGTDQTVVQVETQVGDGERRSFSVGFAIALQPTVEVNRAAAGYVTETIGVAGISSGTDWVWSYESHVLRQANSGVVLTSADLVRITYTGLFRVVSRVEDQNAQNARALLEGGTGIVERVLTDRTISTGASAFQLGGELVEYYKSASTVLRFATTSMLFRPGQMRNVTFAEASLSAEPAIITSVEAFTSSGVARAVVTMVVGPMEGSWAQWFGNLSRRIDKLADAGDSEVEVITTIESFSKVWEEVERPNIFYEAFPSATLFPGSTLVPAFDHDERVLYLSWYDDDVEVARKGFTAQSGASTSEITTITVLTAAEAVGEFDALGWWGGHTASATLGSGVEIDRTSFPLIKTDIEQVQVERTDTKWS